MHGLTVAIVEGESDSMFVLVSFGSDNRRLVLSASSILVPSGHVCGE